MDYTPQNLVPGQPPPPTSRVALASLVLGLLSPLLSLLASLPAILLGLRAIRAINRSDGKLRGIGLAITGMALGAFVTLATVIGLAAILVVRMATERSQLECTHNLRALGIAINQYQDTNNHTFPPGTIQTQGLPPSQRLAWTVAILPGLDTRVLPQGDGPSLAEQIDRGRAWDAPTNAAAARALPQRCLCPSANEIHDAAGHGLTSYIGLAGIDPDAAQLPKRNPRAGFFGYDRTITPSDLVRGLSETVIVAETEDHPGPWIAGGTATVRGLAPQETDFIGRGRPFGGLHPAGANVLRADISVTIVREGCSAAVFRSLSLLAGPGGE